MTLMLKPLSNGDAQGIRAYLKDSGFVHDTFRESPWLRELPKNAADLAFMLERTAHPGLLNLLVRLFFLGVPQGAEAAAGHIPASVLQDMERCGIVRREGAELVSNVMLTPCDDFVFAADSAARMRAGHSGDLVLWPNTTTRLLQVFTAGTPAATALDLGAGCGILGILAAKRSRQVTATDLNPRAEEFTRFNAWLNGVDNVEVLTGDTFEPVEGRKFDLVLANPPFFVTPGNSQMFCENSMELDLYCRRVVREAPRHLNEGGYFQALVEWVQVRGERWQDRLEQWVEGSGCDAWLVHSYARDAATYAEERIQSTWPEQRSAIRFGDWMEYYRQRGVEEVHGGILAMRRRSGENWLRIDDQHVAAANEFGDLVPRTFATQDILSAHPDDEQLLAVRPRLPALAQLEQVARASGGQWGVESLKLQLTGPVPAAMALDQQVAGFVGRCDGERTLGELVRELSGQVKAPPEAVRQQCCAIVRKLAERRLLHLER
jgi:protein-L-isoaspartate O-methyltransferase